MRPNGEEQSNGIEVTTETNVQSTPITQHIPNSRTVSCDASANDPKPIAVVNEIAPGTNDATYFEAFGGLNPGVALSNSGQVAFLAGDAGSGKSSLLSAFTAQAGDRRSDILVGWGVCNAFSGRGDPYLPFRKVLSALTGDVDHHGR